MTPSFCTAIIVAVCFLFSRKLIIQFEECQDEAHSVNPGDFIRRNPRGRPNLYLPVLPAPSTRFKTQTMPFREWSQISPLADGFSYNADTPTSEIGTIMFTLGTFQPAAIDGQVSG